MADRIKRSAIFIERTERASRTHQALMKGNQMKSSRSAFYGIDAPTVIKRLFLFGLMNVGIVLFIHQIRFAHNLHFLMVFEYSQAAMALSFVVPPILMYLTSRFCKVGQRDKLLSRLAWRGNEHVLDVGCGRGLMMIGVAQRLTTGSVIGIDIWNAEDLSDNSKKAALHNARVEGVAAKVSLIDADATTLPFAESTFDCVLSNLAIHNITPRQQRTRALSEMLRVLKPGGTLVIQDFQFIDEYKESLEQLGIKNSLVSGRDWSLFPPVRTITVIKR